MRTCCATLWTPPGTLLLLFCIGKPEGYRSMRMPACGNEVLASQQGAAVGMLHMHVLCHLVDTARQAPPADSSQWCGLAGTVVCLCWQVPLLPWLSWQAVTQLSPCRVRAPLQGTRSAFASKHIEMLARPSTALNNVKSTQQGARP